MFCLHYIFEPRINAHLEKFVTSWNNHSIQTAGNSTPNQLWISGLTQVARSYDSAARELQHDLLVQVKYCITASKTLLNIFL